MYDSRNKRVSGSSVPKPGNPDEACCSLHSHLRPGSGPGSELDGLGQRAVIVQLCRELVALDARVFIVHRLQVREQRQVINKFVERVPLMSSSTRSAVLPATFMASFSSLVRSHSCVHGASTDRVGYLIVAERDQLPAPQSEHLGHCVGNGSEETVRPVDVIQRVVRSAPASNVDGLRSLASGEEQGLEREGLRHIVKL